MPVAVHAVVLGRPQQQAAPAGADVEEALALAQHQLAADVVELGLLRLRQRHVGVAVVGARVHPPRVEPQRIEVVRHVVVELHLPRVGVGAVVAHRLGGAAADSRHHEHASAGRGVARDQLRGHGHHVAHAAVDVEASFDVVVRQPADLAGGEVGQRRQLVQRSASPRRRRAPKRRPPGSTTAAPVCRLENLRSSRFSIGFMAARHADRTAWADFTNNLQPRHRGQAVHPLGAGPRPVRRRCVSATPRAGGGRLRPAGAAAARS